MFNTHPVAAAIRSGRFDSLDNAILSGRKDGMVSLDESIRRLLQDERIDEAVTTLHESIGFCGAVSRLQTLITIRCMGCIEGWVWGSGVGDL